MQVTKDNINEFIDGSEMDCANKGITYIEYIPEGITHLYCFNNKLTELPKLPESLKYLSCYNNQLTELPKLLPMGDSYGIPENLKALDCSGNKLTTLPKLPESLIYLNCRNNNLPYEVTINNYKEKHNKLIKRKEILKRICA